jgi:cellobiose phosphorylase
MKDNDNRYGDFIENGEAFQITTPELPKPWCNYLTNGNFFSVVSHIGTGFSFLKEYRINSLIRRDSEPIYPDRPGRAIYLKESGTSDFWMPNLVLSEADVDKYECIHRPGRTDIQSSRNNIDFKTAYFVPQSFNTEVWRMKITNDGDAPKNLEVYALVDICMGMNGIDTEDRLFDDLFREVKETDGALVGKKRFHRPAGSETVEEWNYRTYMVSTLRPNEFETKRDSFLGPRGSFLDPAAVKSGNLSNQATVGSGVIKCLKWNVRLEAGESVNIDLSIGLCAQDDLESTLKKLVLSSTIDSLENQSNKFWKEFQKTGFKVETKDTKLNAMVNYWNPYQAYVTSHLGRHPSFYSGGSWTCGIRDQAQDAFGILPFLPQYVADEILRLCKNIWSDGRFPHLVSRISMPPEESSKCDSGLWLIFLVDEYLKETGDFNILSQKVGYLNGELKETVYEHLKRLIDLSLTRKGKHGLPLFRKGDWNDALDGVGKNGKGESVWMAQFLVWLLRKMEKMAVLAGDSDGAFTYKNEADTLSDLVNDIAWDGKWYLRGFDDNGTPFGTSECAEGKIFLNTQTWAVISGIANKERAEICLESCLDLLMTPWGPKTLTPAFSSTSDDIGIISAFSPGTKENAGVFFHAASFFVAALAIAGKKDKALEVLEKYSPSRQDSTTFQLEPYVYCNFISSSDSHTPGRGYYHWLTGTAAWMNRVVVDYIFGVRPEYDELNFDVEIPAKLVGTKLIRKYKGREYVLNHQSAHDAPLVTTSKG